MTSGMTLNESPPVPRTGADVGAGGAGRTGSGGGVVVKALSLVRSAVVRRTIRDRNGRDAAPPEAGPCRSGARVRQLEEPATSSGSPTWISTLRALACSAVGIETDSTPWS